jgi:predicted ABC-type ATPase
MQNIVVSFEIHAGDMNDFASIISTSNLLGARAAEPLAFMTVGAQASGKATATDIVLPQFALERKDLVSVQVDEVVANLPEYKLAMEQANRIEDPDARMSATQNAYIGARHATADTISDLILQMALGQKKHILWETTLANTEWPSHMAREFMRHGYTVVVIYPIVNRHEQLRRARLRMEATRQVADLSRIEEQALAVPYHVRAILAYVDQVFVVDNTSATRGIVLHVQRRPIKVTGTKGPVETVNADYRCACGRWRKARHRLDDELYDALNEYLFGPCSVQCGRRKRVH